MVSNNTQIFGPHTGCYSVTIPTGFITTNGAEAEDWAVIDFHGAGGPGSCGYSPGAAPGSGWVWPSVGQPTDFYENILQQHAYDQDAPQPLQTDPTYTYLVPSLISRAYGIHRITVAADSRIIGGQVDLTGGASGSGLLQQLYWYSSGNPEYYISGIAVSADVGWPYVAHYRRLDQNIWNFTKDNCTEY